MSACPRRLMLPIFLFACAVTALGGCRRGEVEDPTAFVRDAMEKRARLSSVRVASGEMRIVDRPNEFSLSTRIQLAAEDANDGRLRIHATKIGGQIVAFDMYMRGDNIAFLVPTQNRLYAGKVAELSNMGIDFSPGDLLHRIFGVDPSLQEARWREVTGERRGMVDRQILFEEEHIRGQPHRRIRVASGTGYIRAIEHVNAAGEVFLRETYGGYETLAGTPTVYPTLFEMEWPREERYVRVRLHDPQMNRPLDAASWSMQIDPDVRRLPLNQIEIEGDDPETALTAPGTTP